MEKQFLAYEKFIKKASEKPSAELAAYHAEMVANFQHERLVHLAVTLFFVTLTLVLGGVALWLTVSLGEWLVLAPLYVACGILVILDIFYIKHYYFLENHVQGLYDYSKKLRTF